MAKSSTTSKTKPRKRRKTAPSFIEKVFPRDNSYRRRDINMVIGPREISSHLRHKALRQFHLCSDGGNTHFKQVKLSNKLH